MQRRIAECHLVSAQGISISSRALLQKFSQSEHPFTCVPGTEHVGSQDHLFVFSCVASLTEEA